MGYAVESVRGMFNVVLDYVLRTVCLYRDFTSVMRPLLLHPRTTPKGKFGIDGETEKFQFGIYCHSLAKIVWTIVGFHGSTP